MTDERLFRIREEWERFYSDPMNFQRTFDDYLELRELSNPTPDQTIRMEVIKGHIGVLLQE